MRFRMTSIALKINTRNQQKRPIIALFPQKRANLTFEKQTAYSHCFQRKKTKNRYGRETCCENCLAQHQLENFPILCLHVASATNFTIPNCSTTDKNNPRSSN